MCMFVWMCVYVYVRVFMYVCITHTCTHTATDTHTHTHTQGRLQAWQTLLAGSAAKMIASLLTYPFQVAGHILKSQHSSTFPVERHLDRTFENVCLQMIASLLTYPFQVSFQQIVGLFWTDRSLLDR